ncbi:hypothetical protein [Ruminiclostridium cellobioparum]|uniref:hypothetical protein n=1 Tax=Ruminiclostridium cellobioparum TaxID=29355 RepID=UPI0028ACEA63|nr:hypothetical protein [Ruminiclostridium cellobioparum]
MRIKKISIFLLITLLCIFFSSLYIQAAASIDFHGLETGNSISSTESDNPTPDPEEEFRSESRSWFQKIGDALTQIIDSIKQIFTKGLSFLIDITIGNILQGFYNKVADGMAKWIFLTPKLIDFPWIKKLWWICYILGAIALVVGLLCTAYSIVTGRKKRFEQKGKEFNPSGLLVTLIVAFIGISLSLFAADTIVSMENKFINSFCASTIYSQYEKNISSMSTIGIEENLKKEEIGFDSFTGDALCRMAYGFDINPSKTITSNFIEESGFSALIPMTIAMIVLSLIGIFGLLRFFVIGILGGAAPFWFSYCSFTGDTDPAWGWFNLFARSVGLSFIFDLAWIFAVYVTSNIATENFFGSGQLIASILFLIALLVAIKFWFKWVIKAALSPLKLAGAESRMQWGGASKKFGKALQKVGSRYGLKELDYAGGMMMATGETQQAIAKEKKDGTYEWDKGSVKDRLLDTRLKYDKEYAKQYGSAGFVKATEQKPMDMEGTLVEINSPGFSSDQIHKILKDNNFEGQVFKTENGKVMIDKDYSAKAKELLQKSFSEDNIEKDVILDNEFGFKIKNVDQDSMEKVEKLVTEKELKHKNIHSISPEKNHFEQFKNEIHPDNFSDPEKYKQYSNLLNKFSADDKGNYAFKTSDESEYKQILSMFDSQAVNYKTNRDLWIDNEFKNEFLENIMKEVNTNEMSIEDTKKFLFFEVDSPNKNDFQGIREDINKKFPNATVLTEKNKLGIEFDESEEQRAAINKVIQDYFKKMPYWSDSKGRYWYKDSTVKRIVPHLLKPEKGRYMGKR